MQELLLKFISVCVIKSLLTTFRFLWNESRLSSRTICRLQSVTFGPSESQLQFSSLRLATALHLQCFYLRKFNSEILEHSQTESKYRRQHVLWVNLFKSSNTFYQKYLKYKHKYPITIFSFIFEMTLQSRSLKVKI